MPFFSVVIPTYNRAKFISATINSVLEQTFDDYELIVVDDGSTDNSKEIITVITNKNPKVKYVWQENLERGAARNHGFRQASGKYVVFMDSDDLMLDNHLAVLHRKINEENSPNFIATKCYVARENKRTVPANIKSIKGGYYDINLLLGGAHFGCNLAVVKDNPELFLFEEDRMYAIFEDWRFIVQNLQNDRIYIVDEYTIVMNDHAERSIRLRDQYLISKRVLATNWIENNITLTLNQKKVLWGFTFQFCAVHFYRQGKRKESFQYLFKSIYLTGIDYSKVALMIKNFLGYKLIQHLK